MVEVGTSLAGSEEKVRGKQRRGGRNRERRDGLGLLEMVTGAGGTATTGGSGGDTGRTSDGDGNDARTMGSKMAGRGDE